MGIICCKVCDIVFRKESIKKLNDEIDKEQLELNEIVDNSQNIVNEIIDDVQEIIVDISNE